MARYLQVSQDIASDIETGLLGPGDELPSIRDAADRYKTTGSTIGSPCCTAWDYMLSSSDEGQIGAFNGGSPRDPSVCH